MTSSSRRRLGLVLVALLVGACAPAATEPAAEPTSTVADVPEWLLPLPEDIEPATVAALVGLPPCETEVTTVAEASEIEGLHLPPGDEITEITEDPPLVTVQGLVAATPVQLRVWLERQEDLEILHAEDEVRESELLVGDGTRRMFIKAQAICDQGSLFRAVIAPELEGEELPSPGAGG